MRYRLLITVTVLGVAGAVAPADSIWDRRDPRAAHLWEDNRARRIGDTLTVAINESTEANEREQRALDKSNNAKAGFTFKSKAGADAGLDWNNNSGRTFSGSAQLTSDRSFADKITVRVVDVLPNGDLVIEGFRSRMVAGERRELRITGIVAPKNIGQQNTVESRFIANFRVSYLGKGPESSFVNQGWFSRIFNRIWPW